MLEKGLEWTLARKDYRNHGEMDSVNAWFSLIFVTFIKLYYVHYQILPSCHMKRAQRLDQAFNEKWYLDHMENIHLRFGKIRLLYKSLIEAGTLIKDLTSLLLLNFFVITWKRVSCAVIELFWCIIHLQIKPGNFNEIISSTSILIRVNPLLVDYTERNRLYRGAYLK